MKQVQVEHTVMLEEVLQEFLLTSCYRRFIRCFTEVNGSYAEYFLETPDELHAFTTSEMISATWQDGKHVGIYDGEFFADSEFRGEGGNWEGPLRVRHSKNKVII